MPRRVYTQSHADYIVEVFEELVEIKDELPGYEIVEQPPTMRHFTASFRQLAPAER
jgi:tryptophanase